MSLGLSFWIQLGLLLNSMDQFVLSNILVRTLSFIQNTQNPFNIITLVNVINILTGLNVRTYSLKDIHGING